MGDGPQQKRRGTQRKGTEKQFGSDWKGFVDIDLSAEDREEISVLAQSEKFHPFDFVSDLLEAGYKFSLAGDIEHNSVVATATGRGDANENQGYALSGRGPDAAGAMASLYWKMAVLCNWGSWLEKADRAPGQLHMWS